MVIFTHKQIYKSRKDENTKIIYFYYNIYIDNRELFQSLPKQTLKINTWHQQSPPLIDSSDQAGVSIVLDKPIEVAPILDKIEYKLIFIESTTLPMPSGIAIKKVTT